MKVRLKDNNKGSTMLVVLISMAFIGVLCALILSVTVSNVQMKVKDKESKKTFYTAEKALSEVTTKLEAVIGEQAGLAYKESLTRYADMADSDALLADFQERTATRLAKAFCTSYATPGTYDVTSQTCFQNAEYLPESLNKTKIQGINTTNMKIQIEVPSDFTYIKFKNLKVTYTNNDYQNIIQTDLKIDMPTPAMIVSRGIDSKIPFGEYSLISDKAIKINKPLKNVGNLYAGEEGIQIDANGDVVVLARNIVTRGAFNVLGSSKVKVTNNSSDLLNVYANELATGKGASYSSGAELTIQGNCYVKDDLTIGEKNSVVKLEDNPNLTLGESEYIGFSGGVDTAAGNSAMIINGSGSELNLTKLSKLHLAGNAYVKTTDPSNISNQDVKTGESVAIKSNQLAYLVPDECISINGGAGHNAMTITEYNNATINTNMSNVNGINLASYLSHPGSASSYRAVFYQKDGTVYVNCYLVDFRTDAGHTIEDYFRKFVEVNQDKMDKSFAVNGIYGNTSAEVITEGNYTLYNNKAFIDKTKVQAPKTGVTDYTLVSNRFNSMINNLEINNTDTNASILNKFIRSNSEEIDGENYLGISKDETGTYRNGSTLSYNVGGVNYTLHKILVHKKVSGYDVIIANNAATDSAAVTLEVPPFITNGLIIATGDVVLKHDFSGLIMAGGTITVDSGAANISSDLLGLSRILSSGDADVNKYFNASDIYKHINAAAGGDVSGVGTNANLSDLITFENWTKN